MSKEENENMMGRMMEKMMEGLTTEDRQKLMGSIMPTMMSQMFGGEGGMPSMMMQMMSTEKEEENPRMPVMKTREDFKPWKFCPCRKLCEKALKEKANS